MWLIFSPSDNRLVSSYFVSMNALISPKRKETAVVFLPNYLVVVSQKLLFCGKVVKHHPNENSQLSCITAVHILLALSRKPSAPIHVRVQLFHRKQHRHFP
uniref:Uncharacterized protein n=1 Tax=Lepeophtheirus salmonis TaxID=72036 RepID=A0A0K2UVX3_LEPSM